MTKLTVIVPIYNVEKYLEECLDSLVCQTLSDMQILLIEDGSSDASPAIAKRYADAYPNIELHCFENGGLGKARNRGVSYAKGEYITFVDSDDKLGSPEDYEKLYERAKETDADLVLFNAVRFTSEGIMPSPARVRIFAQGDAVVAFSEKPGLVEDFAAWNKLYRRAFYTENGITFAEGIYYEDMCTLLTCFHKADRIALVSDVYYHWRIREGEDRSITQRRKELKNLRDMLVSLKQTFAYAEAEIRDPDIRRALDDRLLDAFFPGFFNQVSAEDPEYARVVMEEMPAFLKEYHVEIDRIRNLRPNLQVKYAYLLQGNIEELLAIRKLEKKNWDKKKAIRKETMKLYQQMRELPEMRGRRIFAVRRSMFALCAGPGLAPVESTLEVGLFRSDYQVLLQLLEEREEGQDWTLEKRETGKRDRHRFAELCQGQAMVRLHPIDFQPAAAEKGTDFERRFRILRQKAAAMHRVFDSEGNRIPGERLTLKEHLRFGIRKLPEEKDADLFWKAMADELESFFIVYAKSLEERLPGELKLAEPSEEEEKESRTVIQDMDFYGSHTFKLCRYGAGIEQVAEKEQILLPVQAERMNQMLYKEKNWVIDFLNKRGSVERT